MGGTGGFGSNPDPSGIGGSRQAAYGETLQSQPGVGSPQVPDFMNWQPPAKSTRGATDFSSWLMNTPGLDAAQQATSNANYANWAATGQPPAAAAPTTAAMATPTYAGTSDAFTLQQQKLGTMEQEAAAAAAAKAKADADAAAAAAAQKEFAAPTSFGNQWDAGIAASKALGAISDKNWDKDPVQVQKWLQAFADAGGDWRKTDKYYNPITPIGDMKIYWPGDPARGK